MLPGYRFYRLSTFSLSLALLAAFLPGVHAQTAHFSFAQSTIASGSYGPRGVAVDASGNVYIADPGNQRVLKETLSGGMYTESIVASGLSRPESVAVDASGNVYIANTYNQEVLKETLSGGSYTASTIGSGLNFPCGVAVDASGNVYIGDTGNGRVLKETAFGGNYTQSIIIDSGLNDPWGVAVDASGNVYFADQGNQRVLKETLAGGSYTQSTVASGLYEPTGVAVDASGNNIYIANTDNQRVLKETLAGDIYTESTIGSGVNYPHGLAVDASGDVYIADTDNNRVLKEALSGVDFGSIQIGASSAAIPLTFTFDSAGTIGAPAVVTQGAANLDFTDAGTGTCTTNGTSHSYNAGDTCTVDVLFKPTHPGARYGAAVLSDSGGTPIATGYVYGNGVGPQIAFSPAAQSTIGSSLTPYSLAADASGNVYIVGAGNRMLKETLSGGGYAESTIGSGLSFPFGVAVDGSGNVYIADTYNNRVLKETLSGGSYSQSIIITGLNEPFGVAVDASGNVYIANTYNNEVLKETLSGGSYTQSTVTSSVYAATSVAVDASGNVYISDHGHQRVLKETLSGGSYTESTIVSGLNNPQGVAVDATGNVYIADTNNNQVLKEALAGGAYTQSTIGSGLYYPSAVAVDASGNVYIADYSNGGRVLKEDVSTPPSLSFATTAVGSQSSDSPQTVTMTNNGNAALTFPLPTTGTNPSVSTNFAWDVASTCTQTYTGSSPAFTLAAGASCSMALDFIPTAGGSITGGAVLTDDSLNATPSTQTIRLSGTGIQITLSPTLPAGTYGLSYSRTVTAYGGVGPYTYNITSGSLPAGLSLSSGGLLSGTPVAAGNFNFTITATDSSTGSGPFTGSQAYTLAINVVPQTAINYLIAQVGALYPGTLTSGQENSLSKELQQASSLLSKGKISGAISNLQLFISQVKDLESSGVLTTAQAQPLIDGAQFTIHQLQGD